MLLRTALICAAAGVLCLPAHSQSQSPSSGSELAQKAMARAKSAFGKVRDACSQDVKSLCSSVTPGEGRLVLCMLAHEDKVSDKCVDSLFDIADEIDLAVSDLARAADACADDAAKMCSSSAVGGGSVARCLVSNESKVSSACQAEINVLKARIK